MIEKSVQETKIYHEKLLQKFRAAVHKEFKTGSPSNVEELLDRLLAAQPELKTLTAKVRDKKGRVVKKAKIDRDDLRRIITKEIQTLYDS